MLATVSIAVSEISPVSLLVLVAVFVKEVTEIFVSTVTSNVTFNVSPGFNVMLSDAVTILTGAFALSVMFVRVM